MTLEEAIQLTKQALEKVNPDKRVSTEFRFTVGQVKQMLEWLEDYKQLKADYIELDNRLRTANTENDELKRLLRLAVEDIDIVMTRNKHIVCKNLNRETDDCDYDDICVWRYQDEAMKLLGGNENDND